MRVCLLGEKRKTPKKVRGIEEKCENPRQESASELCALNTNDFNPMITKNHWRSVARNFDEFLFVECFKYWKKNSLFSYYNIIYYIIFQREWIFLTTLQPVFVNEFFSYISKSRRNLFDGFYTHYVYFCLVLLNQKIYFLCTFEFLLYTLSSEENYGDVFFKD